MKDLVLVSSHYKEDVAWLENYFVPVVIVSKKDGNYHSIKHDKYSNVHLIDNVARESGSYLWYIVNFWNYLPKKIFFIHGHKDSYHQKIPIDVAIKSYHNCSFFDFNNYQKVFFEVNENQQFFVQLWKMLYGDRLGDVPNSLTFDWGSQFVVDRDLIKKHPLSFYRRIYDICCWDFFQNKDLSYKLGVFFESTWQFVFKNP